jgi:hypothetical protein
MSCADIGVSGELWVVDDALELKAGLKKVFREAAEYAKPSS